MASDVLRSGSHTGLKVTDAGLSDVHTHAVKGGASVKLSTRQGCQICCAHPRTVVLIQTRVTCIMLIISCKLDWGSTKQACREQLHHPHAEK